MTTATPTKAETLRKHVQNTKLVTVEDNDGTEWRFKILPVSMLLWDETGTLWRKIAKNPNDFHKNMEDLVGTPEHSVVRKVIMQACQEPRVTDVVEENAVPIADLMRHDILVINLYAEIVNHSFSGLLHTEATDARPETSGNS